MTEHRYPDRAIMADFGRAGAGIILTLGPLMFVPVTTIAGTVLSGLGALFAIFALRTWNRRKLVVGLDDEGVTMTALVRKKIAWQDIASLQLRYYAVKRDRSQGWMQLTMKSTRTKMQLESTLDAFEQIVEAAVRAADRNGVELSPSTIENMKALGLPTEGREEGRAAPVKSI